MEFFNDLIKAIKELSAVDIGEEDFKNARHDLITVLLVYALQKKGDLSNVDVARISNIFERTRKLQLEAKEGDTDTNRIFDAIEKLSNPPVMLGKTKKGRTNLPIVDDLLDNYKSSPDLIRGYEIRQIMSSISFVVEPICNCNKPKNFTELIQRIESQQISSNVLDPTLDYCVDYTNAICSCEKLKPESRVRLSEQTYKSFQNIKNEVSEFINKQTTNERAKLTLEGLAKKIYLGRIYLNEENPTLDIRQLNRSMKKLKEFEANNPDIINRGYKLPVWNGDELTYLFLKTT